MRGALGHLRKRARAWLITFALGGPLIAFPGQAGEALVTSPGAEASERMFAATGVIEELPADQLTVMIKHEAISNYMAAMTMPFHVKSSAQLTGLQAGDKISFRLNVADDHSWVDQIRKTGVAPATQSQAVSISPLVRRPTEAFMDYALTNELGERVCLNDFRGQALAITFFYTRCPLPDFCPRLTKNFQAAAQKLQARAGGPTNWHFLSISFDPTFDSPAMLRVYGDSYQYLPSHWSFLTGTPEKIRELAEISGVDYAPDSGGFKHNFRTLIVDAAGRLQMSFPMGGDISDAIVTQIITACAATNQPGATAQNH